MKHYTNYFLSVKVQSNIGVRAWKRSRETITLPDLLFLSPNSAHNCFPPCLTTSSLMCLQFSKTSVIHFGRLMADSTLWLQADFVRMWLKYHSTALSINWIWDPLNRGNPCLRFWQPTLLIGASEVRDLRGSHHFTDQHDPHCSLNICP